MTKDAFSTAKLRQKKKSPICFLLVVPLFLILHHGGCNRIIRTIAGIPPYGGDGKFAIHSYLNSPTRVFYTTQGTYIVDTGNHVIRKVDRFGVISTVVGIPTVAGYAGDGNAANNALLNYPNDIFVSDTQDIYISDSDNHAIRKVNSSGFISTVVGANGAIIAQLNFPQCVYMWRDELYICDGYNHVIRKVSTDGIITIVAGTLGEPGYEGDGGNATSAKLSIPTSIAFNARNDMLIADHLNNVMRQVFANGTMSTAAGTGLCERFGDFESTLRLCFPSHVFVAATNEVYVTEPLHCTEKC